MAHKEISTTVGHLSLGLRESGAYGDDLDISGIRIITDAESHENI